MHAAYRGEWPETYAVYGPVTLAAFRVAGALYQGTVDPTFALAPALASPTLTVLIRLFVLFFHLRVVPAIFQVARQALLTCPARRAPAGALDSGLAGRARCGHVGR